MLNKQYYCIFRLNNAFHYSFTLIIYTAHTNPYDDKYFHVYNKKNINIM